MTQELQTALTLLLVGMLAVFTILALVVLSGRSLIALVNRYFPGEEKSVIDIPGSVPRRKRLDRKKVAAITAAVEQVTAGQGRITKIDKQEA